MDTHQTTLTPPFGAYALPSGLDYLRRMADRIPVYGVRSAVRKIIKSCHKAPYDVTLPNGIRTRINPWGNVCEKRVFCGAGHFDRPEMDDLAECVSKANDGFVFVDIGANVGFYSLFVAAMAQARQVRLRALAIEPDPENARRLRINIALNETPDQQITHAPYAVSDREGAVQFISDGLKNRGTARIGGANGDLTVMARPLVDILSQAEITRIDAMKIDIEGHEIAALTHFFAHADPGLWPTTIIIEVVHNGAELPQLLSDKGYEMVTRADINAIFRRRM
jgi:FkbM family methyltransferase